jgi:hypothetical protein
MVCSSEKTVARLPENMIISLSGLGTKNDCADENQQQFTRPIVQRQYYKTAMLRDKFHSKLSSTVNAKGTCLPIILVLINKHFATHKRNIQPHE